VQANAGGHMNVGASAAGGVGGGADFLSNEATTLGAHSAIDAAGSTTTAGSAGEVTAGQNTAVHTGMSSYGDILSHDNAALGAHGNVDAGGATGVQGSSVAEPLTASSQESSVIHTAGSATTDGDLTAGSQSSAVVAGSQGSADTDTARSQGTTHSSAAVEQHSVIDSSVSAVGDTPDHSTFDPSAHLVADSSSQSLFEAGHDESASHSTQAATDLSTHNHLDTHMGF